MTLARGGRESEQIVPLTHMDLAPSTPLRELNAARGGRRGRALLEESPAKSPFKSPASSTQSPLGCLSPNNDAAEKARARKAKVDQEGARMCAPIPASRR
jgi:hypothetical protein